VCFEQSDSFARRSLISDQWRYTTNYRESLEYRIWQAENPELGRNIQTMSPQMQYLSQLN